MFPERIGHSGDGTPPPCPESFSNLPAARPPRLVPGTQVWTSEGVLPVEFLGAGDRIVTRNRGHQRLRRVRNIAEVLTLVRIPAHALGSQLPERDILLPADQAIHLRGALAYGLTGYTMAISSAVTLAAHVGGEVLSPRPCRLVQLQLDGRDVLYANGLEITEPPVPD